MTTNVEPTGVPGHAGLELSRLLAHPKMGFPQGDGRSDYVWIRPFGRWVVAIVIGGEYFHSCPECVCRGGLRKSGWFAAPPYLSGSGDASGVLGWLETQGWEWGRERSNNWLWWASKSTGVYYGEEGEDTPEALCLAVVRTLAAERGIVVEEEA